MTILRFLLKQRAYVFLSVLTLALGVGANVVVFTIVNALWLRPRPVAEPELITTPIGEGRLLGVVGATSALILVGGCATLAALVSCGHSACPRASASAASISGSTGA